LVAAGFWFDHIRGALAFPPGQDTWLPRYGLNNETLTSMILITIFMYPRTHLLSGESNEAQRRTRQE
jgi:hypothetical protein